jgi:hypothetical protein
VAVHDITLKISHTITLENKDIEVDVYEDGKLLGRVRISRGSIDWAPANKQRSRRVRWGKFAQLMDPDESTRKDEIVRSTPRRARTARGRATRRR